MARLKIVSFNIRNFGDEEKKISNANLLIDMIKSEKIDLLGTQELTKIYEEVITKKMDSYKCYGKCRLGNGLFSKNKFNENNVIITCKKVILNKTIWLPWIADNLKDFKESILKRSIMPRIATMIVVYDKDIGKIRMINTHLDHKIPSVKRRQLNKLRKLIFKFEKRYPVILTGDFNMQDSNDDFKKFIMDLEKYNMKKVNIKENTWNGKNSGKIIDHIFIPKSWEILDYGVLDNMGISDHNPIFVDVLVPTRKSFKEKVNQLKKKLIK